MASPELELEQIAYSGAYCIEHTGKCWTSLLPGNIRQRHGQLRLDTRVTAHGGRWFRRHYRDNKHHTKCPYRVWPRTMQTRSLPRLVLFPTHTCESFALRPSLRMVKLGSSRLATPRKLRVTTLHSPSCQWSRRVDMFPFFSYLTVVKNCFLQPIHQGLLPHRAIKRPDLKAVHVQEKKNIYRRNMAGGSHTEKTTGVLPR